MRPYVAYISHYILINHHFSSFFSSSTFAADFSAILWRRAQAASSVLPLACAPFCASHIRAGMASSKSACQNPMANLGWSWLNSENLGWLGWDFWNFTNKINSWLALVDPHVGIEPTRKWMCSSQVDMPLLDSTVVELSQKSWFISPSKHAWSTHAHIIPFQWRGLNLGHFWACICSILPCPSWGTQQVVKSDCRVAMAWSRVSTVTASDFLEIQRQKPSTHQLIAKQISSKLLCQWPITANYMISRQHCRKLPLGLQIQRM